MRLLRFIAIFCLVFTMLSGYVVVMTPMAEAVGEPLYGDFTYSDVGTYIQITGYVGDGGHVVIPSQINGKTVLALNTYAFRYNTNITSIYIPTSITWIKQNVFQGMTALVNITIPSSVTSMEASAFYRCSALKSVFMDAKGNFETSDHLFANCEALTNVWIGSNVTSLSSYMFSQDYNLTSINFTGLVAPTHLGGNWIYQVPDTVRGHALNGSNFPLPGQYYAGLLMGNFIEPQIIPIVVPPIVNITNDFSLLSFINLLVSFLLILLPSALIGIYVGRYGFVITLSLMMVLYLIIDPIILPAAIVVWTQTAVMFYRGG